MTCEFEAEIEFKFDFDHIELYEAVVEAVLDILRCPYEATVSLTLTSDEEIKLINKETRDIDAATDVLSFPMNDYPNEGDFSELENSMDAFDPDSGELILGDIVLSYDHVLAQAYEYGHSIEREYAFLITHSMLHLCGYDHMQEEERGRMEDKQKEIIDELSKTYPDLIVK